MSFNALDAEMSESLYKILGEQITYRRCTGETVSTWAIIDLDMEQYGDTVSGVAEYRNEISLLRADIDSPRRGDAIVIADGTTYTVQDRMPGGSDKVEIKVIVK